jgi:hypothetical protein
VAPDTAHRGHPCPRVCTEKLIRWADGVKRARLPSAACAGVTGEGTGCQVESGIRVLGSVHARISSAIAVSGRRVFYAQSVPRVISRHGGGKLHGAVFGLSTFQIKQQTTTAPTTTAAIRKYITRKYPLGFNSALQASLNSVLNLSRMFFKRARRMRIESSSWRSNTTAHMAMKNPSPTNMERCQHKGLGPNICAAATRAANSSSV